MRATRRGSDEQGFALVTVLGSMTVLTLVLLGALAFGLATVKPARGDQDGKAAVAAAQAGLEEYVARLNTNDGYWRKGNVDCDNLALIPPTADTCSTPRPARGVAVPGSSGAATYHYRLLSTTSETESNGIIRLSSTGWSKNVRRELVGQLSPTGFLQYIYFTDVESTDPALYKGAVAARLNGKLSYDDTVNDLYYVWDTDRGVSDPICSKHWYAGRSFSGPTVSTYTSGYTAGNYTELIYSYVEDSFGNRSYTLKSSTTKAASDTAQITFDCKEIRFSGGDKITGPMKTNDALLLSGDPWFTSPVTETAWATAPDKTKAWREASSGSAPHPGTSTEAGYKPVVAPPLEMPDSNADLIPVANSANGCVYRGETRITFNSDGTMRVKSPLTDGSVPRCYEGGNNEKVLTVPPVIYVDNSTASCTGTNVGYPTDKEHVDYVADPDYGCAKGNVYISGMVKGRTTLAAANEITIVGNVTYAGGASGTDALGLVPNNFVWVHHAVDKSGANVSSSPTVTNIEAAILTVTHSFVVQNWDKGAALTTSESTKLRVFGSISQRFRGPVGTGTPTSATSGYLKNYVYDKRLLNNPPPYFLRPVESPYRITKVTD